MVTTIILSFEDDKYRLYLTRFLVGLFSVLLELIPFIYIVVRLLNPCSRTVSYKMQLRDNYIFAYLATLIIFEIIGQIVNVPIANQGEDCVPYAYISKASELVVLAMHFYITFIIYALTCIPMDVLQKASAYFESRRQNSKIRNYHRNSSSNNTGAIGVMSAYIGNESPSAIAVSQKSISSMEEATPVVTLHTQQSSSQSFPMATYKNADGISEAPTISTSLNQAITNTSLATSTSSTNNSIIDSNLSTIKAKEATPLKRSQISRGSVPLVSMCYYYLTQYSIPVILITVVVLFLVNIAGFFSTVQTAYDYSIVFSKEATHASFSNCGIHSGSRIDGLVVYHPLYILITGSTLLFCIRMIMTVRDASFHGSTIKCLKAADVNNKILHSSSEAQSSLANRKCRRCSKGSRVADGANEAEEDIDEYEDDTGYDENNFFTTSEHYLTTTNNLEGGAAGALSDSITGSYFSPNTIENNVNDNSNNSRKSRPIVATTLMGNSTSSLSTSTLSRKKNSNKNANIDLELEAIQIKESKKKIAQMLYGEEKENAHYVENFGFMQNSAEADYDGLFGANNGYGSEIDEESNSEENKVFSIKRMEGEGVIPGTSNGNNPNSTSGNINSRSNTTEENNRIRAQVIPDKVLADRKKDVYKHGVFIEDEISDDLPFNNDDLAGYGLKLVRYRRDYVGINSVAKKVAAEFINGTKCVIVLPTLITIIIFYSYILKFISVCEPTIFTEGSIFLERASVPIYLRDILFSLFINIGFFANIRIKKDCDESRRSTGCCLKIADLITERDEAKKIMDYENL